MWFGVMYSANYLAKKYVVKDASKIVNLSTIYRIVFLLVFVGGGIFYAWTDPNYSSTDPMATTITVISTIISTAVFYAASKKYVKQDAGAFGS